MRARRRARRRRFTTAVFRLIFPLNALDHIEDDHVVLEPLRDLLDPDELLLVYVPALQFLDSSMDRNVAHFNGYRRPGLVQMLASAGYVVEHGRYVDSIGFLAAIAYWWLGRDGGTSDRTSLILYDQWAFSVSVVLDRLAGRWFGKDVLAMAKVPAT